MNGIARRLGFKGKLLIRQGSGHLFLIGVTFFWLLTVFMPSQALSQTVDLSWEISNPEPKDGELVEVRIYGDLPEPIIGFGGYLRYSHDNFERLAFEVAPPFIARNPDGGEGFIAIADPPRAAGERVPLLFARFKVIQGGTGRLIIDMPTQDKVAGFVGEALGEIYYPNPETTRFDMDVDKPQVGTGQMMVEGGCDCAISDAAAKGRGLKAWTFLFTMMGLGGLRRFFSRLSSG